MTATASAKRRRRRLNRQRKALDRSLIHLQAEDRKREFENAAREALHGVNPRDNTMMIHNMVGAPWPNDADPQKIAKAFAAIVNPFVHSCRPAPRSGVARPTAHLRLLDVYPLTGSSANTVGDSRGLFTAVFQPHFGDIGSPSQYRLLINDPTTDWPSENSANSWADSSFWSSSLAGRDPRVARYHNQFVGHNINHVIIRGGTSSATSPFGDAPAQYSSDGSDQVLRYIETGTHNRIYLPKGTFFYGGWLVGTGFTAGSGATTFDMVAGSDVTISNEKAEASSTSGVTFSGTVTVSAASSNAYVDVALASATTVSSGRIYFDPNAGSANTSDFGEITEYQIGQAALHYQFEAPEGWTGGKVGAALGPPGTVNTSVATINSPPTGNLALWENVANMNSAERYIGKVKHGAYVFWRPADSVQYDFHKPSAMLSQELSSCIISGYSTSADGSGGTTGTTGDLGMILAVTNVYYYSSSPTREHHMPTVSKTEYEYASAAAAKIKPAMENSKHIKMFERVMKDLGSGLMWGVDTFVPAALRSIGPLVAALKF